MYRFIVKRTNDRDWNRKQVYGAIIRIFLFIQKYLNKFIT